MIHYTPHSIADQKQVLAEQYFPSSGNKAGLNTGHELTQWLCWDHCTTTSLRISWEVIRANHQPFRGNETSRMIPQMELSVRYTYIKIYGSIAE